jgi:NADP-dependent 3-hydroxy acid dehydrogenase YdfG
MLLQRELGRGIAVCLDKYQKIDILINNAGLPTKVNPKISDASLDFPMIGML